VIGAFYLDAGSAQVVRMAFNFTRAAFLDDHLEDLAVMLENRLIAGQYWLPSRQTIEIRRTGTYLDFPVRGIIKGNWEIGQYQFNLATPAQVFTGPEIISAPAAQLRAYPWQAPIMETLPPDIRSAADPDIERIQEEARVLVRARALERIEPFRLSARRVSDFVRVNRVEGLSFGGGFSARLGSRVFLGGRARMGMDDHHMVKGFGSLRWEQPSGTRFELFAGRDLADVGEQPERSLLFNSLATQEFASDMTDAFNFEQRAARFVKRFGRTDVSLYVGREQHKQLEVFFRPVTGAFLRTPEVDPLVGNRAAIGVERAMSPWIGPGRLSLTLKASALRTIYPPDFSGLLSDGLMSYRGSIGFEHRANLGPTTLVIREHAAATTGDTTILQEAVYFGGPSSLPGYDLHEIAGRYGSSTRLELQIPIPSVAIPLGRFGKVPGQAKLAPFFGAAFVGGKLPCAANLGRCPTRPEGLYPTVGIGALSFFDLLRLDVARGLRDGRWMFNIDVNREFWSIM
jgi:hypothetical protein